MTIYSPDTIDTTILVDNVSGLITPAGIRSVNDSLAGIYSSAPKTATPYVLVFADRGTCIEMNLAGANTVNIPTNASVAFDVGTTITIYQMGAGQTTIAAVTPATTTIRPLASPTIRAQYSSVTLRKRATDEWVVSGDMT